MVWIAEFDDTYELCTVEELRIQIISVLRGRNPQVQEDRLFHEAAIMRNEFMSFLPVKWMEQFIECMSTYIKYGFIEECQYSRIGKVPPPFLF